MEDCVFRSARVLVTYQHLQHFLGLRINFNDVALEGRDIGHVVVPPLTLLFLQFDGNSTHLAVSQPFYQMGDEAEWKTFFSQKGHIINEYKSQLHSTHIYNEHKMQIKKTAHHKVSFIFFCKQKFILFLTSTELLKKCVQLVYHKWSTHPAILFLRGLLGMIATSSQMRLLAWKSKVRRVLYFSIISFAAFFTVLVLTRP